MSAAAIDLVTLAQRLDEDGDVTNDSIVYEDVRKEEESTPKTKPKKLRVRRAKMKQRPSILRSKRVNGRRFHPALWCLEVDGKKMFLAHCNDGKGGKSEDGRIRLTVAGSTIKFASNRIVNVCIYSSRNNCSTKLKLEEEEEGEREEESVRVFNNEDKTLTLKFECTIRGGGSEGIKWYKPTEVLAAKGHFYSDDPALVSAEAEAEAEAVDTSL